MRLNEAEKGKEYIIQEVNTGDDELNSFLFSLGCYSGEPITIISKNKESSTICIKDARYRIDNYLVNAINVKEKNCIKIKKYN